MKTFIIAAALAVSAFAFAAPASAAPVAKIDGIHTSSPLTLAQYNRHRTKRTVRPRSLAVFGPVWGMAAWCELRVDFRTFRLDRMEGFSVTPDPFKSERGCVLYEFHYYDESRR